MFNHLTLPGCTGTIGGNLALLSILFRLYNGAVKRTVLSSSALILFLKTLMKCRTAIWVPLALAVAARAMDPATMPAVTDPKALKLSSADMQWWQDAKFGMFIHWGLYAIPA